MTRYNSAWFWDGKYHFDNGCNCIQGSICSGIHWFHLYMCHHLNMGYFHIHLPLKKTYILERSQKVPCSKQTILAVGVIISWCADTVIPIYFFDASPGIWARATFTFINFWKMNNSTFWEYSDNDYHSDSGWNCNQGDICSDIHQSRQHMLHHLSKVNFHIHWYLKRTS